jgi:hypothetical protein
MFLVMQYLLLVSTTRYFVVTCFSLAVSASTSNTEILERFQSKALLMIVDAPWYVPNTVI